MNVKKCVRALLCLYLTLIIAMDAVKAQALKIGDSLPPELWSMPLQVINHPQGKETITLSEYKDKLIILDFWATWCAPCIKSLSKLDTLQKEFGGQLAVIPITYEPANKAATMFKKRGWSLPSVVNDSLLKKNFPYRIIPHQVWVREGKVQAITGAEYATNDIIKKILNRESVHMKVKEDKPQSYEADSDSLTRYRSSVSVIENSTVAGIRRRKDGIAAYNLGLQDLIREAYVRDIPFYGRKNRVQVEPSASTVLSESLEQYTYSLSLPRETDLETIYRIFKNDILNFIEVKDNLKAQIVKQTRQCLVLEALDLTKARSEGGTHKYENQPERLTLQNTRASRLEYMLGNIYSDSEYPLKSTLPADLQIDIVLHGNLRDIDKLSAQLLRYGLSLQVRESEIDVLVITKITPQ